MVRKTALFQALDRAVRIAKAEPAGHIHIVCRSQSFIQERESGVVLRPDQSVDDPSNLICRNGNL